MKIGFIGTGTMGLPMVANLVKKGFAVTAYDVVPAALDAAARLGAERAGSVREAAADCDLVITMLPSSANVATAGTLAIMVGGDASDLEEARPALAAMCANIIHVGGIGAGEVAKLCN